MKPKSFENIYHVHRNSRVKRWFYIIMALAVITLFLPWTQNIKTTGTVTTLYQEQRPQLLNSPIPGRITKWHVKNGDFVKKGDTILQLSEIKEDYMDPLLLSRTEDQVEAKKGVRDFYEAKIGTTDAQLDALNSSRELKLQQLKVKIQQLNNKLAAEEAELKAANNELNLSADQYERQQKNVRRRLGIAYTIPTAQCIVSKRASQENRSRKQTGTNASGSYNRNH